MIESETKGPPGGDLTPRKEREVSVERPRDLRYGGVYSWPPRFFRKQEISYEWENIPWIRSKEIFGSPQDDISFFLSTDEDSAWHESYIQPVLDVCHGLTLQALQSSDEPGPEKKTALLIDGQKCGQDTRLRPFLGALSARELKHQLGKERYAVDLFDPGFIDAERRLIYITDVDRWSILALVGSAPESQARLLGDFLVQYLCSRSSLSVSFAVRNPFFFTDGPETFALEFSLPYRVWRTTPELMKDDRENLSDNQPLRTSTDVTFLRRFSDVRHGLETTDGIYTGHISCLVSGHDQWRWTGVLAIDTWFEEELDDDPPPDRVTRYENDREDGMLPDPLCRGREEASRSRWHPRAYFLRVLEVRLGQIKREWEAVLYNLQAKIRRKTQRPNASLARFRALGRGPLEPLVYQGTLREFDDYEMRIIELRELLQELAHDLQDTVRVGDSFMKTEVNYFLNNDGHPGDATECFPHLSQIRRTFNDLRQMHMGLEDMVLNCKAIQEDCESARRSYILQLQLEMTRPSNEPPPPIPTPRPQRVRPPNLSALVLGSSGLIGGLSHLVQSRALNNIIFGAVVIFPLILLVYSGALLRLSLHSRDAGGHTSERSPSLGIHHQGYSDTVSEFGDRALVGLHNLLGSPYTLSAARTPGDRVPTLSTSNTTLVGSATGRTPEPPVSSRWDGRNYVMRWLKRVESPGELKNGVSKGEVNGAINENPEYVPICVPTDGDALPLLEEISEITCYDDRTLFEALRKIIYERPWSSWKGLLSRLDLRKPTGMHYVKFELYGDGFAGILRRALYPSDPDSYRPTEGSFEPVPSRILIAHFERRSGPKAKACHILDRIIHKRNGRLTGKGGDCEGFGMELEMGPNIHRLEVIRFSWVVLSFLFGLIWSSRTKDVQSGFAIAGCLALLGVVGVTTVQHTASDAPGIPSIDSGRAVV